MDLNRRRFSQLLTALGLMPAMSVFAAEGSLSGAGGGGDPQMLRLSRNGWMPNNEHLPVLLYRGVMPGEGSDPAGTYEAMFKRNG